MPSLYSKNRDRFPHDSCQSCGTRLGDEGIMCNECKEDFKLQGIDWKKWLDEYDTTRNPAYDGPMGIFEDYQV